MSQTTCLHPNADCQRQILTRTPLHIDPQQFPLLLPMSDKKLFCRKDFWRQNEAKSTMGRIAHIGLLLYAYDTEMRSFSKKNHVLLHNPSRHVLDIQLQVILYLNSPPQMVKTNGTNLFHVIQIHDSLRKGRCSYVHRRTSVSVSKTASPCWALHSVEIQNGTHICGPANSYDGRIISASSQIRFGHYTPLHTGFYDFPHFVLWT